MDGTPFWRRGGIVVVAAFLAASGCAKDQTATAPTATTVVPHTSAAAPGSTTARSSTATSVPEATPGATSPAQPADQCRGLVSGDAVPATLDFGDFRLDAPGPAGGKEWIVQSCDGTTKSLVVGLARPSSGEATGDHTVRATIIEGHVPTSGKTVIRADDRADALDALVSGVLEQYKGDRLTEAGAGVTTEPTTLGDYACTKFEAEYVDTQVPGHAGEPYTLLAHGIGCLSPTEPVDRFVAIIWSERYPDGHPPLSDPSTLSEVASLMTSLRFGAG